jgi:hypothetical protein
VHRRVLCRGSQSGVRQSRRGRLGSNGDDEPIRRVTLTDRREVESESRRSRRSLPHDHRAAPAASPSWPPFVWRVSNHVPNLANPRPAETSQTTRKASRYGEKHYEGATRNEGVPGSNPGVGSLRTGLRRRSDSTTRSTIYSSCGTQPPYSLRPAFRWAQVPGHLGKSILDQACRYGWLVHEVCGPRQRFRRVGSQPGPASHSQVG